MTPPRTINKVTVFGASGSAGQPIVHELLKHPHGFEVSVVLRDKKKVSFPAGVTVLESDYSPQSLRQVLSGQDAVVSTINAVAASIQEHIIDAAIESGVVRFLPSEFGVDTAQSKVIELLPSVGEKTKLVQYLKTKEQQISWTSVVVGSFFDWSLRSPGLMGWNIPEKTATIFDGGEIEFEATNVAQIGRAVAAILSPKNQAETANQYVYVNSFTLTQNKVLAALEKVTGEKFKVTEAARKDLVAGAIEQLKSDPAQYSAHVDLIVGRLYDLGGLNSFSRAQPGGLWNTRLGLPVESLEATIAGVL